MKRKEFSPHIRIETDYYRAIRDLLLENLNLENVRTPSEVLAAFENLATNPRVLIDIAKRLASRMVTQVRVSNARSWREAAAKASRGREIYESLQSEMETGIGTRVREIVAENAKLISSIPEDLREDVNREIAGMERQGLRPETLTKYLTRRVPELTRNRAILIARTETGKAATALTRARSENLGINWYQWATSEDQRVRPSHRKLDHVLVSWSDPPAPEALAGIKSTLGHYNAGNAPNCRCDAYPIISLDQISWPARVYVNGRIRRMTRAEFSEMSGIKRAA